MADITYDKIIIVGIEYSRLINVEINKRMNTHSDATITCEVSKEEADKMSREINDGNYVMITTTANGDSEILFLGVKYNVTVEENAGYYVAKMELKSTSYLLDKEKKKRTFQNTQKTHYQTMEEIVSGKAVIQFNVTDKPLNTYWLQVEETDWNMLIRIASGCNACVIANVNTQIPIIDIGMSDSVNAPMGIGAMSIDTSKYIIGTTSTIKSGILETTCLTGYQEAFRQERITSAEAAGKMFTGIVQKVEKEKVQVFFDGIDANYDEDGDTWFEYSATYAGTGEKYGSGIYFMPEVGDRVRVFFPDGDGGEGFAFASEASYVLEEPEKISWRTPGGQELLFTQTGIRISGKDNSVYIDLLYDEEETGIQITCDTDIQLSTLRNEVAEPSYIYIEGKEEILISADNQILLETPETSIEMNKDKIIMNANHLYIQ